MADALDDKKLLEATGTDAAYDTLEKDFQEVHTVCMVMRSIHC